MEGWKNSCENEKLVVERNGEEYILRRYTHNSETPVESYRPMRFQEALIGVAAIMVGVDPPKHLVLHESPDAAEMRLEELRMKCHRMQIEANELERKMKNDAMNR